MYRSFVKNIILIFLNLRQKLDVIWNFVNDSTSLGMSQLLRRNDNLDFARYRWQMIFWWHHFACQNIRPISLADVKIRPKNDDQNTVVPIAKFRRFGFQKIHRNLVKTHNEFFGIISGRDRSYRCMVNTGRVKPKNLCYENSLFVDSFFFLRQTKYLCFCLP